MGADVDMHRFRLGDRGPAVAEIRTMLDALGLLAAGDRSVLPADPESAIFDNPTDRAVREFQQRRGLSVTGVVDAETYRALDAARWQLGDRLLAHIPQQPMDGDDVSDLQRRLHSFGFEPGNIDGLYGPVTEQAVRKLQSAFGIVADGVCGFATLEVLGRFARGEHESGAHGEPTQVGQLPHEPVRLSGKVIVLDPGHGGADHGARSDDLSEAELMYDLASRIEGRLTAIGVRAFLTRGRGRGDDHPGRAAFANDTGAELLISLHVDALPNPEASGLATYYFESSAIGERFAGLIQREILARTDLLDCRTHAKTWELLRLSEMPAVRLELGYLSNPGDAARLADPAFRDVVAEAVVVATHRLYLPPEDDYPTGVMQLPSLTE